MEMYHVNITTKQGNQVYVSTIFDRHARFWNYETKIFGLTIDENYVEHMGEELYVDHYMTGEDALIGHKKACEYAINNL